jgi:hypothetical protein
MIIYFIIKKNISSITTKLVIAIYIYKRQLSWPSVGGRVLAYIKTSRGDPEGS